MTRRSCSSGRPPPGRSRALICEPPGSYRRMCGARRVAVAAACSSPSGAARWPFAAPFRSLAARPVLARWVSLAAHPAVERFRRTTRGSSGRLRAAPGASSRRWSAPRTTFCRPTTSRRSRSPRRPPDVPDQRRALPALDPAARDLGWIGTPRSSSGWRRRSRPLSASSAFAATSTTGTTHATCGRSSRATSRRSTAATWPGT